MKIKKESLSLLIEYIILETRAAREWIKANVDPEDPIEGADLLIAYNEGIIKLDVLSWIKKIRKLIPINYQQLGIPLSPGEVTQTDVEYDDSIDILYIVDLVRQFLKPQNQNMMRGAGIHTNLTTSYYPNIMSLKKVIDLIEATNKRREEEKLNKQTRPAGGSFVSDDNPQGFDPTAVDVLGQVGPWSVLMPITMGGSIACDINTARDTTWCTTKREGENLFHNYVGSSGQNVILFYVMDYSRKPDDPKVKREKSCMANNDSRLSIGFVAGSPALGGGNGGLSVDAANKGLNVDDVQRALGPHHDQIMKLLKDKYDSMGGVHPAQGIVKKAAGDIFFLRDHVKDYKQATKQSFYDDLANYWYQLDNQGGINTCLEYFSQEVIDFLFWQNQNFHNSASSYVFRNPSVKQLKNYIRKIDAAKPPDPWIFQKDPDDVDVDVGNFSIETQSNFDSIAYTKARALERLVGHIGEKLNKATLTVIHDSVVNYLYRAYKTDDSIIDGLGSQINLIKPENLDEKTFARYVVLEYARTNYSYGDVKPDALPDDIIEYQRDYNQIPVTDLVNQVVEDAKNKIDELKSQRNGNMEHVYVFDLQNNLLSNITGMLSNPTSDRFLNEQDFSTLKVKENYLKYFELAKEYDRNEVENTKREFPVELILCKSIYDRILHYQFDYLVSDVGVPMEKIQHIVQPTGEIAYKLLEMFPGIKSIPLIPGYKIADYFDQLQLNGLFNAANAVGGILASGALSVSAVEKIVTEDFPKGYFYTFIHTKDKYQTDKIAMHLFNNVKLTKYDKYIVGSLSRYLSGKYPEKTLEIVDMVRRKEEEMMSTSIDDILDIEVEY